MQNGRGESFDRKIAVMMNIRVRALKMNMNIMAFNVNDSIIRDLYQSYQSNHALGDGHPRETASFC